jgi:short subunit dehydrogenase-like uncharacterized protein
MSAPLLLYGCYGYTGRLLADEALRRGLRPTLAGRNRDEVEAMGRALSLPTRVFALDDRVALDAALADHKVVFHAAGPFDKTSRPMVDACLRTGVHYLDVTGEIAVFEAVAARNAEAKAKGVVLFPGVGFDVVPSDCLAAHVASKVPGATKLVLAFQMAGRPSKGTALTMVSNLHRSAAVRRGGRIEQIAAGALRRTFDFGEGPRAASAIGWGDVSTAFYSTGIPDIEVYLSQPRPVIAAMRLSGLIGPLLASAPVQKFLRAQISAAPAGPSEEQRARRKSRLYAEATAPDGRRAAARLVGHEAYTLTAEAGIRIAEKTLAGEIAPGFQTPSRALGADFVLTLPDVVRTDL